jgi:2-polyprenyl-6-methoxyphenol hydroxylase-like FAD-dependent oxidoreductase
VRAQLRGAREAPPVDAGATVFRGVVDSRHADARGLCPAGAAVHAHTPDGRTLSIASLGAAQPLGLHDGSLFWVLSLPGHVDDVSPATVPRAGDYTASEHAEARALTWLTRAPATPLAAAAAAPTVGERIAAAFLPDFADVAALLAATPAGAITERRLFHRTREGAASAASYDSGDADAEGGGVVTLLGDAAHMSLPSLGVGACLSLRAADALAAELDAACPRLGERGCGEVDAAVLGAALRRFEGRQRRSARRAARGAAAHARRVAAAPQGDVLPTSGAAFAGWLAGNAHRGGAAAAAAASSASSASATGTERNAA